MAKQLLVAIGKDGSIEIEASGFPLTDGSCVLESNNLVRILKNAGLDIEEVSIHHKTQEEVALEAQREAQVQVSR